MDPSLRTGIRIVDKITRQEDKEYCDPYLVVSGWVGRVEGGLSQLSPTHFPAPPSGRVCGAQGADLRQGEHLCTAVDGGAAPGGVHPLHGGPAEAPGQFKKGLSQPLNLTFHPALFTPQVKDSDLGFFLNADDVIATHFVSVSEISSTTSDSVR